MTIEEIRMKLTAAAASGAAVRIVYHGGSQPGTVREIRPLAVSGSEVRARDVAAGIDKTFLLAKLEFADSRTDARSYDAMVSNGRGPVVSVREALASHFGELAELGWQLELHEDTVNAYLVRPGKRGKSASVQIGYSPMTSDFYDDLDGQGMQEHVRPSKRPYWVTSTKLGGARTFTHVTRAVSLFLDEAHALALQQKS